MLDIDSQVYSSSLFHRLNLILPPFLLAENWRSWCRVRSLYITSKCCHGQTKTVFSFSLTIYFVLFNPYFKMLENCWVLGGMQWGEKKANLQEMRTPLAVISFQELRGGLSSLNLHYNFITSWEAGEGSVGWHRNRRAAGWGRSSEW